ncbi:hypothetical protein OH146_03005 [Salinibacterium sp. SYSU T00001]|uniref:hypothetical protein n=1 Tax=Homoserinimonas sedimenticola TaxID=2986805 RepID=UPI0022357398|nr:hypothetical protein [Salinibacterium sedimenticola]MCW4384738.1 hypothetical protein [Salinibacterium sedimenticola]
MQWWNDVVDWINSDEGWQVISTVAIPFLAIVVAGILAALIGRGATRRVIAMTEQERRTSTVAALISAARRAARWNSLSLPEQQHAEHLIHDADTRLRLLPMNGSGMVADWAAHEITEMKRNSVSFSFQAEQSLIEFRNRLVEWQAKPGRAKKLFKADLDAWAYEAGQADQDLIAKQKEWAKQQVNETGPVPTTTASRVAASPADEGEQNPFRAPDYTLPESVATREKDAPVEDWAGTTPSETTSEPEEAVPAASDDPSRPSASEGAEPASETPGPVSAGTVRQRTNPDERDY